MGAMTRRIGASFIKSRQKHIFVFVSVFAFMFTVIAFLIFRGSYYVIAVTLLACCVFELVCIFVFGLLSKSLAFVKMVASASWNHK